VSDEDLRLIERQARDGDRAALVRLTHTRLRTGLGVLWAWIEKLGDYRINLGIGSSLRVPPASPEGPPGTIEMIVRGFSTGGDVSLESRFEPPPPADRKAWVIACLDVERAVFALYPYFPNGKDVDGPYLLDLASGRMISTSVRRIVSILPGAATCRRSQASPESSTDS
jgi:hypothetical protein